MAAPAAPAAKKRRLDTPLVSVCLPVHNCEQYLDDCLASILGVQARAATALPHHSQPSRAASCCTRAGQVYDGALELSIFDDGSSDGSAAKIEGWAQRFRAAGWSWVASRGQPNRGEGHARNRAVRQSHGEYICVMDADDMMQPCRVARQLAAAQRNPDAIIGGGFRREPEDATWHYTGWANGLSEQQLLLQQYREVTLLHPTWFHTRALFDAIGGYVEHADHADELRSGAASSTSEAAAPSGGGRLAKKLGKAQASVDGFEAHCSAPAAAGWDEATKQAKQQQLAKLRQKRDLLAKAAAEAPPPQLTAARAGASAGGGGGGSASGTVPAGAPAVAVDLRFFHAHLDRFYAQQQQQCRISEPAVAAAAAAPATAVALHRVSGAPVLTYRHRPGESMCTHTSRRTLLRLRLRAFERRVLSSASWAKFTIWGAGRDGRNLLSELQPQYRKQVRAMCDIDPAKIKRGYASPALGIAHLPVVPFKELVPPFVVCVAKGRTDGELEANVASLGLVEGVDYWHFS